VVLMLFPQNEIRNQRQSYSPLPMSVRPRKIEYLHPATIRDAVKLRLSRIGKRFAKGTLVVLLSCLCVSLIVAGIWWYIYGRAWAISADDARVELRSILGHLESEAHVHSATCQRRFDGPDAYYYKLRVQPSHVEPFVGDILSAWTRQPKHKVDSETNPSSPENDEKSYDLVRWGTLFYYMTYSTSTGKISILEFRFDSPHPIIPDDNYGK